MQSRYMLLPNRDGISLGDIHNVQTLWVLALFRIFYKFCFNGQTCHHIGGGDVYTF